MIFFLDFNNVVFSYLLSINTLVENHANRPNIDSVVNDRRSTIWSGKALWREIPVSSSTLGSQLDSAILLVPVEDLLGKPEIGDFDVPANRTVSEKDISLRTI